MALIGFTVFREKILDGTKTQTIRKPRKRPIKAGETLYLYWHARRLDCELLKVVQCSEVLVKKWGEMKNDLELAKRDGFSGLEDFRNWFVMHYNPTDETEFIVIRWGDKDVENEAQKKSLVSLKR